MTAAVLEQPVKKQTVDPIKPERIDVCACLDEVFAKCQSREGAYRKSLKIIGRHFNAPLAMIQIESRKGAFEESIENDDGINNELKKLCKGLLFKTSYKQKPQARFLESTNNQFRFAIIAVPVREGNEGVVGAMAIMIACKDQAVALARVSEFNAISALVGRFAASIGKTESINKASAQTDTTGASKASGYGSLHEYAFAITNNLKGKLDCDQVCLGLVKRNRVKMLCMSGFDDLYPRSPGALQIEQAMSEALDAGHPVCFQEDSNWSNQTATTGHQLHKKWSETNGNCAVASIPLFSQGKCIAILSLRLKPGGTLESQQIEKIGNMVSPLIPGILLLIKANKSLFGHTSDSIKKLTSGFLGKHAWSKRLAAVAVLLVVGWVILGHRDYIISVPSEIVPSEVIHFAAPFEAPIKAVCVKPGQQVRKGDVLLILDTTELDAQQQKLSAEIEIARLEENDATAKLDLHSAALANARARIAEIELENVRFKLAQAEIRAPADGKILLGDLNPRIGEVVPHGEPLIQFASNAGWRIKLHVTENVVDNIESGMQGHFLTNAQPDDLRPIKLTQVHFSSDVIEGKNVFVVEANLQGAPPRWVKAGMKGVSRVNVGQKPEWYILFSRPIDAARMFFWKF